MKTSAGKELAYAYTLSETGNNTTINVTISAEEVQKLAKYESTSITLTAIPGLAYDYSTLKTATGIVESLMTGNAFSERNWRSIV